MRTPGNLLRRGVFRKQLKARSCKDQKANVEWNKLVQQKESRGEEKLQAGQEEGN